MRTLYRNEHQIDIHDGECGDHFRQPHDRPDKSYHPLPLIVRVPAGQLFADLERGLEVPARVPIGIVDLLIFCLCPQFRLTCMPRLLPPYQLVWKIAEGILDRLR